MIRLRSSRQGRYLNGMRCVMRVGSRIAVFAPN